MMEIPKDPIAEEIAKALPNIVQHPADILSRTAEDVTEFNDELKNIVEMMVKVMHKSQGIGLAAPQIGINKSIAVFNIGEGPEVLINPVIYHRLGKVRGQEGCLSCEEVERVMDRSARIGVSYYTLEGKKKKVSVGNMTSVVIQHEVDHLNGKCIADYETDSM